MDHSHYDWSPLNASRAKLTWPDNARVALCVIVVLECVEWHPSTGNYQVPNLAGGYGWGAHPNVTAWSHREYGHRVGVYRVLDVLAKHGIKPTIAVDALTAKHYPYLIEHCRSFDCEFIAHGMSVNQMITSRMSADEESDYIRTSVEAVTAATGVRPVGWLGPEHGESMRTPGLLARAGLRYVCDWVNDEQPYRMQVEEGDLHALPVSLPLDDIQALWNRRMEIGHYRAMIEETFDTLHGEGDNNGRLLVLTLHPFLIGQPFRIGSLDAALENIVGRGGVWTATGGAIVDWYRRQRASP